MLNKVLERGREPSSWAGLAGIVFGIGELLKIREAPAIGQAIQQGGEAVAVTGDPVMGGVLTLSGILAVLLGERGKR